MTDGFQSLIAATVAHNIGDSVRPEISKAGDINYGECVAEAFWVPCCRPSCYLPGSFVSLDTDMALAGLYRKSLRMPSQILVSISVGLWNGQRRPLTSADANFNILWFTEQGAG